MKTEKCTETHLQAILVPHWVLAPLMAQLVPCRLVCQQYLEVLLYLVHPQVLVLQEVLEVQEVLLHPEVLVAPHFQAYLVVPCLPATESSLTVQFSAHTRDK
jgi:hypothetical protein